MSLQMGDTAVLVLAKLIEQLVRKLRIKIGLGPFGSIDVALSTPFTERSIDERLEKIETARQNLAEALTAMDEMRDVAESNKRDLERLTNSISKAESDKADLNAQLDALKQIAAIDSDAVREALRLPTEVDKWKERIWGFIFGLIAGLIATVVWEMAIKPEIPQRYFHEAPLSPTSGDHSQKG